MTRRTVLQRFNLPIADHLRSVQLLKPLSFLGLNAPFPVQIGNFVQRPQLGRRVAMAIEAERHGQRLEMINLIHLVNGPMAFHTTDSPVHMDRVVKINVIRHAMNLNPGNWPARLRALSHQCQSRIIPKHLIVAIHTGSAAGNIGVPGLFDTIMAIPAVGPQLTRVGVVGKSNWLNRLVTDPGVFRRQVIPSPRDERAAYQRTANHD